MTRGIIAVDLDGTLLDGNGSYSKQTRDYFRLLSAAGFAVVLASGRPVRSIAPIYEDLECQAPVIAYNGSLVYSPSDSSFPRFVASFPMRSIQEIYRQTKGYVDAFMAESLDTVYINKEDDRLNRYFPYAGMKVVQGPLEETLQESVYTCLFKCPSEHAEELKKACESHEGIGWRSWSKSDYSELFVPGADKGEALEFIMMHLGVAKEDVYAFGDAENDITMLERAGHPFAMKRNKVPHLLAKFPETENPVEEDGVMVELQKRIRL